MKIKFYVNFTECGVPRYAASRVIGGSNARPGSWPWQVAIYYNNRFHCGGSLVNANWLVTAAHCVERTSMSGFTIVLGRSAIWTQPVTFL